MDTSYFRISGVAKRFDGLVALDGINLDLPQGQTFCVIGPNGSGKTTSIAKMVETA